MENSSVSLQFVMYFAVIHAKKVIYTFQLLPIVFILLFFQNIWTILNI